jgi:branched-chain amino acid transport system ATP-binding protein
MGILEIKELSKDFGGLQAVRQCSFTVGEGQIVSLIGPNGAGKTTVFNLISGIITPTAGDISFDGSSLVGLKTHEIAERGIGRSFQNIQLFNELSVLDNVKIGGHRLGKAGTFSSLFRTRSQRSEERETSERAMAFLTFAGVERHQETAATNLAYGDRKRVEIARALMMEPKLLMLDEPNSGMNTQETLTLIDLVRRINQEMKVAILVISHHMEFVHSLSDWVVVLNFGQVIASGKASEVVNEGEVIEAYLGRRSQ